jgi:hypothetical protein
MKVERILRKVFPDDNPEYPLPAFTGIGDIYHALA